MECLLYQDFQPLHIDRHTAARPVFFKCKNKCCPSLALQILNNLSSYQINQQFFPWPLNPTWFVPGPVSGLLDETLPFSPLPITQDAVLCAVPTKHYAAAMEMCTLTFPSTGMFSS